MSNVLLICKHDVNSTKCGDDLAIGYTNSMSKKHATRTIPFRLICLNPPASHFGLQDKNKGIINRKLPITFLRFSVDEEVPQFYRRVMLSILVLWIGELGGSDKR